MVTFGTSHFVDVVLLFRSESLFKVYTTVEPLIKATPDARTPLYKGHFAESQMQWGL